MIPLGCSSHHLKEDISLSASEYNYQGAEIKVLGHSDFGVSIKRAYSDEPFLFSVGGLYSGSVNISSQECQINETKNYTNFEYVNFILDLKSFKRCVIAITITPYFDPDISELVKWKSVNGLLAIKTDDYETNYQSFQIRNSDNVFFTYEVTDKVSRVFLKGCGYTYDQKINHGQRSILITPHEMKFNRACVIEGFIKGELQNQSLALFINKYDDIFSPLPTPSLIFNEKTFEVNADHNISLIGLGDKFIFGSKAQFYYKNDESIVRLYSNQGRTAVCFIYKNKKDFKCLN